MASVCVSELSVVFGRKTVWPARSLSAFGTYALAISTAAAALTCPAPCVTTLSTRLLNRAAGGSARVRSADGDRVRAVAGAVNRAVDRAVDGVAVLIVADDLVCVAVVARGGDDDDAGEHGALDGDAERVFVERLAHGRAEAQVDDADVVALLVGDGPVNRGYRRARRTRAAIVEHLEVYEARFGRDADVARGVAA